MYYSKPLFGNTISLEHSFLNDEGRKLHFSQCFENNASYLEKITENSDNILIDLRNMNEDGDIMYIQNELESILFKPDWLSNRTEQEYFPQERPISQNAVSLLNNELESKNKNVNKNHINKNLNVYGGDKKENKYLDSKKLIIFKTENPSKSLIFNSMNIDDEYIKGILYCKNINIKKIESQTKSKNYNIKKYEKKKKVKNIIRRKDNTDNIRIKIITFFFKILKINLNKKLKSAGSKRLFKIFPRKFSSKYITKILNAENKKEADLTFLDIFSKNFCEEESDFNSNDIISEDISEKKEKRKNLYKLYRKNYKENLEVLNYLEGEKEICQKIKFDQIKKLNFSQMFKEFLKSPELYIKLNHLKNEDKKYYERFIIKIGEILNFFSN